MNAFKSLLLATVSGCTLLSPITINPTAVSAQSLFPSHTQYVAQQTESSSLMVVQLPQLEVNLDSGKSSEIMGQLSVPLQLSGLTVPTGAIVRLNVVPTEDGDVSLIADRIIIPSNGMTIDVYVVSVEQSLGNDLKNSANSVIDLVELFDEFDPQNEGRDYHRIGSNNIFD